MVGRVSLRVEPKQREDGCALGHQGSVCKPRPALSSTSKDDLGPRCGMRSPGRPPKRQRRASYQPGLAAQVQGRSEVMRAEGPSHRLQRFCLHPDFIPERYHRTCQPWRKPMAESLSCLFLGEAIDNSPHFQMRVSVPHEFFVPAGRLSREMERCRWVANLGSFISPNAVGATP